MLLTPAQIKPKSFESRRNSFLPGVDAPHVYVRAWALDCFHSRISTQTFRRALTASVDSCTEIKSALFFFLDKSEKVSPFNTSHETVLNMAEFGGRFRKAVLGV